MRTSLPPGLRFGRYVLSDRLGSGHFGEVFSGVNSATGDPVAVKVEPEDISKPRLPREARVYQELGARAAPRLRWFGRAHGYLALVMDRLGASVRSAHRSSGMRMSVSAVRQVGLQALDRLEVLHTAGWLHLDVKPANLLLPAGSTADGAAELTAGGAGPISIHLVDYGLARRWRELETGAHTPAARRRGVVGTGRFASLSNHLGEPLGRRDDLEALGLTLAFLRTGRLPWSSPEAPTKAERFALMLESKQRTSVEELGSGLPPSFTEFMHVTRGLSYDELPDYRRLRRLLGALGESREAKLDRQRKTDRGTRLAKATGIKGNCAV